MLNTDQSRLTIHVLSNRMRNFNVAWIFILRRQYMNRLHVLIAVAALSSSILLSGCTRFTTNTKGSEVIVGDVEGVPLEVDVNVGEKISGTCLYKSLFGFAIESPGKLAYGVDYEHRAYRANSECIQGATYQALTKSNADVVIAPRYFSDEYKFLCLPFIDACVWRTQNMTVTGYKGTYGSFNKLSPDLRKYRELQKSRSRPEGNNASPSLIEPFVNKVTNLFSK